MAGLLVKNNHTALFEFANLAKEVTWQQAQWQQLVAMGFPSKQHQDWLYTPLSALAMSPISETAHYHIDSLSYESLSLSFDCYRLVFFDGKFSTRLSDWIPNVEVTPVKKMPEEAQQGLRQSVNGDALSLLIDATASAGVWMTVKPRAKIDKPIYLFHLSSGNKGEVASYRHHIEVGEMAQCEVIEHHLSLQQSAQHGGGVSLSRFSAKVADNASLNHTKLIEEGDHQAHYAHNDVALARDSQMQSTVVMLSGAQVRHQTSSALTADNGYAEMNSLALPRGKQVFDTRTYLRHQGAHCSSQQCHKVIAQQQAIGSFDGMILVDSEAIKTDGQMDNHNLLLSDNAKISSKPKLEIYADDVKCSHGATTGQLDPDQLFYLQARGIAKPQAEQMIIYAFAAEVIEKIPNDYVRRYASRRWNHIWEVKE